MKPLSGDKVAQIISEVYSALDPKVACRLVNPNVLLALAGTRYYADIHWIKPIPQPQINTANKLLEDYKIKLTVINETEFLADGYIESLNGLVYTTNIRTKRWCIEYEYTASFSSWYQRMNEKLMHLHQTKNILKVTDIQTIIWGIMLGYPDQAILDCIDASNDVKRKKLEYIQLNYPTEYATTTAIPNFKYDPIHANNKDIINFKNTANKIFNEFYRTEFYKDLVKQKSFIEATKSANKFAYEQFHNTQKGALPIKNK